MDMADAAADAAAEMTAAAAETGKNRCIQIYPEYVSWDAAE